MSVAEVEGRPLSKEEFRHELIKFIKPYTSVSTPDNGMRCIQRSFEHFSKHRKSEQVLIYSEAVFAIIEIFEITDSNFIKNTLEEYILSIRSYCTNSPVTKFSRDSFFYSDYVLYKPTVTQTLLRYGVKFDPKPEDLLRHQEEYLWSALVGTRLSEYDLVDETLIDTLINEHYQTYHAKRRLYFIVMHLLIVIMMEGSEIYEKTYKNFRKSLELIYMTITDPKITVAEVQRFLQNAYEAIVEEEKIISYCQNFVKHFPTSDQTIQPRSLQHLCCCHVRESLIRARKLPYGIKSLHLPKSIQNYLLVQNDENKFLPKFLPHLVPEKRSDFEPSSSKRLKTS